MITKLLKLYRTGLDLANLPLFAVPILNPSTGQEHNISMSERLDLLWTINRNYHRTDTEVWYREIFPLVIKLLETSPEVSGDIVECGCYTAGLTATLSHVAELTGRHVHAFDSFEGMPDGSSEDDAAFVGGGEAQGWTKGEYKTPRQRAESNIRQYGVPERVTFHEGWFENTLPELSDDVAFVFVDADYGEAAQTCLLELWPRLSDGAYYFSHGIQFRNVAKAYYDDTFWQEELGRDAPGIVGAGSGLGLNAGWKMGYDSFLGYTCKTDR